MIKQPIYIYGKKMYSLHLLPVVITILFSFFDCLLQQTIKPFDEKKFLGKHYISDTNNHYVQNNKYDHWLSTVPASHRDQSALTNHHDHRNLLPQRKTSTSNWFQQHPVAAPIRSQERSTDLGDSIIQPLYLSNNHTPINDQLSENFTTQSSWASSSSNVQPKYQSKQKSATDTDFANTKSVAALTAKDSSIRYERQPDISSATESAVIATTATIATTKTISNLNFIKNSLQDTPESYSRANLNLGKSDNHFSTAQYTSNSFGHSFNHNKTANQLNSKLDHSNHTPQIREELIDRGSLNLSSKAFNDTNNTLINQHNYQQSTIKLTSIKTFEGSTETSPSIVSSNDNDHIEYNSIGRHSTNWWALGTQKGFNLVSKLTKENFIDFCQTTSLLSTTKQRTLCEIHPKIMQLVAIGLRTAIEECQYQFNSSRWNCSVIDDGIRTDKHRFINMGDQKLKQRYSELSGETDYTMKPIFGRVMVRQNRERSFLSAIMSAGIAYSITKACSRGDLPDECGCDQKLKNRNNHGRWDWGGCSEDIDYGLKFSRDFTGSTEYELDTISMINVHNYEVGRLVLKSNVDLACKCHGVSGSCVVRTCWKRLGSFRDIGDEIVSRYDRATHVQLTNQSRSSRSKLRPVKRGARKPNKKDLVFIDESPDYCTEDKRLGILGTRNRECNSTSDGLDGCKLLCCGRGYQNIIEDREEDCECKFVWCCEVKCQKCKQRKEYDSCN